MKEIGASLYLGVLSVWDVRTRKLPLAWMVAGGLGSGVCLMGTLLSENIAVGEILGRMLPGAILLALAHLTHQVGQGDGWLLVMVGCLFPYRICMGIFLGSLLLTAVAAGMLMVAGRAGKQRRLPYVPFLNIAVAVAAFVVGRG